MAFQNAIFYIITLQFKSVVFEKFPALIVTRCEFIALHAKHLEIEVNVELLHLL